MMNCLNCNNQLDDHAKFCNICGSKVEKIVQVPVTEVAETQAPAGEITAEMEQTQAPAEEVVSKVEQIQVPVGEITAEIEQAQAPAEEVVPKVEQIQVPIGEIIQEVEQVQAPVEEVVSEMPQQQTSVEEMVNHEKYNEQFTNNNADIKNKFNLKNFINRYKTHLIIGVSAILLLIIAVNIPKIFRKSSDVIDAFIYVSDNKAFFKSQGAVKTNKKGNVIADSYISSIDLDHSAVTISDDGKRIFFPRDFQSYSSFDLYYKNTSSKNDNSQLIDEEIVQYVINSSGSRVYYLTSYDELYVHDLSKKTRLEKDVKEFYVNTKTGKIVYLTYDYELYSKDGKRSKKKIDSDVTLQYVSKDLDKVFYSKEDKLYLKNSKGDSIQITKDFNDIINAYDTGEIYYTVGDKDEYLLYDFIDDSKEREDNALKEMESVEYPYKWDFEPRREKPIAPMWSTIYDLYVADMNNNQEDEVGNIADDTEDIAVGNNTPSTDDIRVAVDELYDKAYAQYEEDLEAYEAEWDKAYNDALKQYEDYENLKEKYDDKINRDEIRDYAKNNYLDISQKKLYYFDGKDSTEITSSYSYSIKAHMDKAAFVYYEENMNMNAKVDITDIYSSYSIESIIGDVIKDSDGVAYVAVKGERHKLSDDIREVVFDTKAQTVYVEEYGYKLYSMELGKDSNYQLNLISGDYDDYRVLAESNKVLLFEDDEMYLDEVRIDEDVSPKTIIEVPGSDVIYYLSDLSKRRFQGTLKKFDGKKAIKVAEDVSIFLPLGEDSLIVMKDYSERTERGSLLICKGRKLTMINDDVSIALPVMSNRNSKFYLDLYKQYDE